MKILSLEFKNFNSYGNKIQRIDFPQDQAGFFLVQGQNGVGKTTIKEVIEFVLYAKISGKKLKDIPNRINGGAWAKMELTTKNKHVIIEAGLDPSIINLTVNGVPYNKANLKGPREYLTDELLDIPFHVFNNIVSISINDFKSFLNMSNEDKKKIVDKIFGFHIINQMRDVLKGHTKAIKDKLDSAVGTIEASQRSLNSSLSEMDQLLKKIQEHSDDKIKEAQDNLDKFKQLLDLHKTKMGEFLSQEKTFKDEMSKMTSLIYKSKSSINEISNKLKLYDNSKCPTCASDLTTEDHVHHKHELEQEMDKAKKELAANEEVVRGLKIKEADIEKEKRTFFEKESTIKNKILNYQNEIRLLDSGPKDHQLESVKNIIKKMEEQIDEAKLTQSKNDELMNWNKMIDEILGEKGVKQLAVKTILPALNAEIYRLMNEVHLDYRIVFAEDFSASILHLGADISIATLSRGERKKVDFVVLIAIIRLMKMRFPSINLLFLDEIFDGIDADGIYGILKILAKSCKDMGLNTFVISHVQTLPNEIFDYRIEIEKKNNFSNLTVEKA